MAIKPKGFIKILAEQTPRGVEPEGDDLQFISELHPAWPLGSDSIEEGDDHIRMIKQSLHGTFPQLAIESAVEPVWLSAELLRSSAPRYGDHKTVFTEVLPGTLYDGWVLAEGLIYDNVITGYDSAGAPIRENDVQTPNFAGKFIQGGDGSAFEQGTHIGGSNAAPIVAHTHGMNHNHPDGDNGNITKSAGSHSHNFRSLATFFHDSQSISGLNSNVIAGNVGDEGNAQWVEGESHTYLWNDDDNMGMAMVSAGAHTHEIAGHVGNTQGVVETTGTDNRPEYAQLNHMIFVGIGAEPQ